MDWRGEMEGSLSFVTLIFLLLLCGTCTMAQQRLFSSPHPVHHVVSHLSGHNRILFHKLQHAVVLLLNHIITLVHIRSSRLDLSLPNQLGGVACHNGVRLDVLFEHSQLLVSYRLVDPVSAHLPS